MMPPRMIDAGRRGMMGLLDRGKEPRLGRLSRTDPPLKILERESHRVNLNRRDGHSGIGIHIHAASMMDRVIDGTPRTPA